MDKVVDFEVANTHLRNLLLSTLFYAPFCPPVMLLGAFGALAHYYVFKYKFVTKSSIPDPLQTTIPMFMANKILNVTWALFFAIIFAMSLLNLNK